jgi:hypothetical protein
LLVLRGLFGWFAGGNRRIIRNREIRDRHQQYWQYQFETD